MAGTGTPSCRPCASPPRFAGLPGDYTRIAVGGAAGWHRFEDSYDAHAEFSPDGETRADDPLLLYFTSGTTAKPKMVLHTHQSYPVGHLTTLYVVGLTPGDVHLNISSPGWAKHAYSSFFAPWNAEATIVVPTQPRFDATETLDLMVRCGVTTFCAPPTVWRILVQQDLARWPVRLREAVSAGEPLNPEVIAQVERIWGITVRDFYGQTETTSLVGNTPGQKIVPGSMGRPLPGYRMEIIDEAGNAVDEGEIAIALNPRPVGLMAGVSSRTWTAPVRPIEGAHYRTGDTGTRAADGRFTYVGRSDDVFKSSDYRISPFEIESALIEHEAVAEAAVVPSPDERRMAVPKAFIVLIEGRACRPRHGARHLCEPARGSPRPISACGGSNSPNCRKPSPARSGASSCASARPRCGRGGKRAAAEFWEEDFSELSRPPAAQ